MALLLISCQNSAFVPFSLRSATVAVAAHANLQIAAVFIQSKASFPPRGGGGTLDTTTKHDLAELLVEILPLKMISSYVPLNTFTTNESFLRKLKILFRRMLRCLCLQLHSDALLSAVTHSACHPSICLCSPSSHLLLFSTNSPNCIALSISVPHSYASQAVLSPSLSPSHLLFVLCCLQCRVVVFFFPQIPL